MYLPSKFKVDEPGLLHEWIREYSFATVISQDELGAPFASHLPLLLRFDDAGGAVLVGHMARANSQWRHFLDGREVLAIFHGPHGYISPSWYVNDNLVPTWNYLSVHAYGLPRIIDDAEALGAIVDETVEFYESGFETPWKSNLPGDFRQSLLKAIVGFEIPVSRIEGKAKLGQNRPEEDVDGVCSALEKSGSDESRTLAKLMRTANGL